MSTSEVPSSLPALLAPVLADAGSLTDDADAVALARRVCQLYAREDAANGLSRREIEQGCRGIADQDVFDRRFGVWTRLGMLRPRVQKAHEPRYLLEPAALLGIEILGRLARRGGVAELSKLLGDLEKEIETDLSLSADACGEQVDAVTGLLQLFASEADRVTAKGSLSEVIDYQRRITPSTADGDPDLLISRVRRLSKVVTDRFGHLDAKAWAAVEAAGRYSRSIAGLLDRLLAEGGRTRDFSILHPEAYRTAARHSPPDRLAAVLAGVVWDPPRVVVDPEQVIAEAATLGPPPRPRQPAPVPQGEDPIDVFAEVEARQAAVRERTVGRAEQLLGDADTVEVREAIAAAGWPGAAITAATMLIADIDESIPFAFTVDDETVVDVDGPVTLYAGGTLRRTASREDGSDG